MEDLLDSYEKGTPTLPYKRLNLIIPTDQDVSDIKVTVSDKETFVLKFPLFPVQPEIPTSINKPNVDFTKPDTGIYNSSTPFPAKIVKVVSSGYFDATNHIIGVEIYPVQYVPKGRKVIFHKKNFIYNCNFCREKNCKRPFNKNRSKSGVL